MTLQEQITIIKDIKKRINLLHHTDDFIRFRINLYEIDRELNSILKELK